MSSLKGFLISLPMLVVPLTLTVATPVKAEVQSFGPTGALSLLAQSRTADKKCNHLSKSEHSELSGYVARAEIAAASMEGSTVAKSARRDGAKKGRAMTCGRGSEELVRASLDAARRAMKAAERNRTKPKKVAKRTSTPPPSQTGRRNPSGIVATVRAGGLNQYKQFTTAYYLERRCKHLSRRSVMNFYNAVVARHRAVLRKYPGQQVASAKREAEQRALRAGRCSARTARIVHSSFNG